MADFGFVGGAYEAESRYQDAQELINWYCEVDKEKAQGERGVMALYPTPGLSVSATPGGQYPVRALHTLSGNNNLLAVVGSSLYTLRNGASATNATMAGAINGFNNAYDLLGNSFETVNSLIGVPTVYKTDWQGKQLQYTTARTNNARQSQALNAAVWVGCAVTSSVTTFNGVVPFWNVAKITAVGSESLSQATASSTIGETRTITAAVMAVSSSQISIGVFGSTDVWGANADSTALIISGPGTLTQVTGALWIITGLSNSTPTLVAVTRTYRVAETTAINFYPDTHNSTTIGASNLITRVQIESGSVSTSYIATTAVAVTVIDYVLSNPAHIVFSSAPLTGSSLTWNGNYISSIAANNTSALIPTFAGNLNTSSGNVSISDNGVQAMIVDGANRYSYATNGSQNAVFTGSITNGILTITAVTSGTALVGQILTGAGIATGTVITYQLTTTTFGVSVTTTASPTTITATGGLVVLPLSDGPFTGGDIVDTIDNYFVFNYPGTQQWAASNALSTTTPALSFASKFSAEDKLVAIAVNNRIVYLLGEVTTEAWSDVGSFPFPFALIPGSTAQHGCAAKGSVAQLGDSFAYVSRDRKGQGIIVIMNGYSPVRISTHAVEASLAGKTISDAVAYSYQLNGHEFYAVTFPTVDVTWVYDLMTDKWHKWLSTDTNGVYHRSRVNCMAVFNGQIYAGDYQNGNIYAVSNSVFTDNGNPIRRMRRCPHLVSDFARVFHEELQIQFQPGVGLQTGQGSNPQAMLRWSDDGGSTWSNEHWLTMGLVGKYKHRIIRRRMGYARDRVYEVAVSDPVFAAVVSANLKVSVGE